MPDTELTRVARDRTLLFIGRAIRMFAYGFLAVVLGLYLMERGHSPTWIGFLITMTLLGDTVISLWLTTAADRFGRRKTLLIGAGLMLLASIVFAMTGNSLLLVLAATIGVISPSGYEVGPFLAVEQASLSHVVAGDKRTSVFAWYNLVGTLATAVGALAAGHLAYQLQLRDVSALNSYRCIVIGYGILGLLMAGVFAMLSPHVEVKTAQAKPGTLLGLHKSRGVIFKLSSFFAIDAFGGGFVVMTFLSMWFKTKYPTTTDAWLGNIFFGANVLAALSALSASWLARRIGLINTMVFTHLPSNVLLMLVPFMPTVQLAVILLWVRYSISQMDVPTRQSYTMAVVDPDERSAAAGVTGVARSIGAMLAPSLAGKLLANPATMSSIFFIGGGMKIIYDILLYRSFTAVKPPEEASVQIQK